MSKGDMKKVREKFSIGDKIHVKAIITFGYSYNDVGHYDQTKRIIVRGDWKSFDGIVIGGKVRYEGIARGEANEDYNARYLETTKQHVLVMVKRDFFGKIYECLPEDVTIIS